MVLEDKELDSKIFENLSENQINLFKKSLEYNNITYEVLRTPTDMINDIIYEARGYKYKSFKEFIDDLNAKSIAEIYLYKVYIHSDNITGEMVYTIRYAINIDLISVKIIKKIKKLIGGIRSNKNVQGISTDKIKRILGKQDISEEASRNIIKLIRILEKEFSKPITTE